MCSHVMVHLVEHSAPRNTRKFVSMVCHNITIGFRFFVKYTHRCCHAIGDCGLLPRSCEMSATLKRGKIHWRVSPITSGGSGYS